MKKKAAGVGKWQKIVTERNVTQHLETTRNARGLTQGTPEESRQAVANTPSAKYGMPKAGKVKSPVSNHGNLLSNHGNYLGVSAASATPSPMTRSQTVILNKQISNNGTSQVRGLVDGVSLRKARYAKEYAMKSTVRYRQRQLLYHPIRESAQ
jgi:hypothetical protein